MRTLRLLLDGLTWHGFNRACRRDGHAWTLMSHPPACARCGRQVHRRLAHTVTDGPLEQWHCKVCGRFWCVATLARLCEQRHQREAATR